MKLSCGGSTTTQTAIFSRPMNLPIFWIIFTDFAIILSVFSPTHGEPNLDILDKKKSFKKQSVCQNF